MSEPITPASHASASPYPIPTPPEETPTHHTVLAEPARPPVGAAYITLLVLAQLGVFIAFITPLAISLSIRLAALAPGHEQYLGYILGAGSATAMLTGPLIGVMSDRTRTRLGRRRPWMMLGLAIGIMSLLVMALAPSVPLLACGWILAQVSWGSMLLGGLGASQADRLPEAQRGKVAGLIGFATQVGPVVGFVLAGGFARAPLQLFLVPGLIGVVLAAHFIAFVREPDVRTLPANGPLTLGTLFGKFLFRPRQYPDFTWNWISRFLFYVGLTFNTTFTAFFFSQRLGIPLEKVAGIVAGLSALSILATTLGAIGGGFLSDRLRRRRIFVLAAATIFSFGVIIVALSSTQTLLFAGSLICSLGIGAYSAVDQALLLDVLPERDTDAGRFLGITGFATQIPQSIAPLIAPLILGIGVAAGGDKNYTLLYLIAAAFTLLSGMAALRVISVR